MTILGHSFGGYLALCYTLKYSEHVSQLILASPVGIFEEAPSDHFPLWVRLFWLLRISPFSIVRSAGPLGPKLVSRLWATKVFPNLPYEEYRILHKYCYAIFRQQGSGEHALSYILGPGARAISPLASRMQKLDVPIMCLSGEEDWNQTTNSSMYEWEYTVISHAGHHVYLDAASEFNKIVWDKMKEVEILA